MLDAAIHRKTLISMLFIGLTLLGYISYRQLPVELTPMIELPYLIVQVQAAQEMTPAQMERQAIIPLEGAVGTLAGIEQIDAYADRTRGRIFITYNDDVNLKYAYLRLQEKIDAARLTIPDDFFIQVLKIDTEQLSNMFMILQVRGDGGVDRVRHVVDARISEHLEAIDGIASVQVSGGREKSVEILLNNDASKAYGVTPTRVRQLVNQQNQYKTFVGRVETPNHQSFVNVVGEYTSVSDLERIVVNRDVPVFLKDIAEVRAGVKEETSRSRVNGQEAVTVQLVRDSQVNIISLAEATYPVIERLNAELADEGVIIVVETDTAEYLRENIDLILNLALSGGLLAVLILWFFLRNLRLIVVIALSLPISIFTAFNFFYAFDVTLNTLTLVGMALAVGMLVDNSIVVLENIYRIARQRWAREQYRPGGDLSATAAVALRERIAAAATLDGTREIWRSITAATFTTVCVFLPFVFAEDRLIRILGYQIGVSIVSTLLVSLAVALLLVPMVTHYFLRRRSTPPERFSALSSRGKLMERYTVLLKSTIRYPVRTLGITTILFFSSVLIALLVSVTGGDDAQVDDMNLYVTMPAGATLETSDLTAAEVESLIDSIPEVADMVVQIYEEEAILSLKLKEDFQDIANRPFADVKADIERRIAGYQAAEVSFEQPTSSGRFRGGGGFGGGNALERRLGIGGNTGSITIKGRDFEILRRVAEDIEYQVEQLASVASANINVADNRPEMHLFLNRPLLTQFNITPGAIIDALNTFREEVSTGVKFRDANDEYDIMIRNADLEIDERDIDDLRRVEIESQNGSTFPLAYLANIVYSEGSAGISRVNQERQVQVSYRFISEVNESGEASDAAKEEIDELLASLEIPEGVAVAQESETDSFSEFYFLITLAAIFIYMILASVFESLLSPLIIMFTIPLAAIGSLWAIIITGNSLLNANTLIGMLILLGIVVNNGIILIDYTRLLRRKGYRYQRALLTAGQARLRPILITAITTIVAMLPLAMGKVEYATQIAAPFAITVIGGLTLSTLFTLVLIPTTYAGLESFVSWFNRLPLPVKLLQATLVVLGSYLIYQQVDSYVWRAANFSLLLAIVPGLTYFIRSSLRTARADLIAPGAAITIRIRHLSKIYDFPGRLRREWRKTERREAREGRKKMFSEWRTVLNQLWQFLLLGFLIYFTYGYLGGGFWNLFMAVIVYFYGYLLLNGLLELPAVAAWFAGGRRAAVAERLPRLYLWALPALNLFVLGSDWMALGWRVTVAVLWYSALVVFFTSRRLHRAQVKIERISGRFSGLRKWFYRLVKAVPVIGKQKVPFTALDDVSLEIHSGMFGLLGPNGAGKTTLMRIICGIFEQSYGSITINGIDVKAHREELQGLIGYLPQDFGAYENMSAYDYLAYQAILKGLTDADARHERIEYVLQAVHLEESRDERIGSFSGGMKQRVGIAQTLLHLPSILVVDEPTAGLDPRERIRFRNLLVDLSRERVVIFSTHVIEDIASSCDRVAVLNRGRLRYLGQPQEMAGLARGKVWQFYIAPDLLEDIRKTLHVVHHMRVGEQIRIRCIAESRPATDAEVVSPTLEDAYLYAISTL